MRPYSEVSEKLRTIFFAIIYTIIPIIRFMNGNVMTGGYNVLLSQIILFLLVFALIWTYFTLIRYFYRYFAQQMSDNNELIVKIFEETDHLDKRAAFD